MEQVFVDTFKTIINYWMNQELMGPLINFLAVIELAVQAWIMSWGTATAPLNEE
jgi:hypothetical protein